MSYREGLKNAEIAARLGIAEITVKKKKAKILALLSSRMGDISPAIVLLLLETLPYITRRGGNILNVTQLQSIAFTSKRNSLRAA